MSLSDLSDSDKNDDDDVKTGSEDNTCYGDGGGERNTSAGGGSAEWMRFPSLSALSETLGAMAKAKASPSTESRKKPKLKK